MQRVQEILNFNRCFVENKRYELLETDKFPNKKMVIVTCMDTRLTELLPKAMNLKNGDAKIIKTAGAIVSHLYGSVMKSILISLTILQAEEVFVIGHHDCGMMNLQSDAVIERLQELGISAAQLDILQKQGIDLKQWLSGFNQIEEGIRRSVDLISYHPLLPKHIPVYGLVIDPATGKLDLVTNRTLQVG